MSALASKTASAGVTVLPDQVLWLWRPGRQRESCAELPQLPFELVRSRSRQLALEDREDLAVDRAALLGGALTHSRVELVRDVAEMERRHAAMVSDRYHSSRGRSKIPCVSYWNQEQATGAGLDVPVTRTDIPLAEA